VLAKDINITQSKVQNRTLNSTTNPPNHLSPVSRKKTHSEIVPHLRLSLFLLVMKFSSAVVFINKCEHVRSVEEKKIIIQQAKLLFERVFSILDGMLFHLLHLRMMND
jgi:hypothetical protein